MRPEIRELKTAIKQTRKEPPAQRMLKENFERALSIAIAADSGPDFESGFVQGLKIVLAASRENRTIYIVESNDV